MITLPGSIWGELKDRVNNDVYELVGSVAPTNGTSGTAAGLAGPGSTYVDYTNKIKYINTNTKASPTWTKSGGVQVLDGVQVSNVANANVIGGVPVLHRVDVAAGATGDVDTVLTHKTRVINSWLVKTAANGGGAGTIQVKNGANAITDAMSINVNDQSVVIAATIDDAQHEIAAGGTMRITRTRTSSTSEACTVYVSGVRVA